MAQSGVLSAQSADRLNSAAAQRMLSQRIAKAYAQQLVNVLPTQAAEVAGKSVQLFNANLSTLRAAGLPPDALRALAELERASAPLVAFASAPVTKERLDAVSKSSEESLAAAEALVRLMPASSAPGASLVAMAGRQRMLSQRAASKFFMYQAGLRSPEVRAAFDKSIKDFDAVLGEFRAQVDEFPEVRDEVELASVQMEFFKTSARTLDGISDAQKATVARSSERLLETMDSLTREMIAKFAARELSAIQAQPKKSR
jgi:hypothetical protein